MPRLPRNYDGPGTTTHRLGDLVPTVLKKISGNFADRPDLILAAWPDVIGARLAPLTEAVSFIDGVLTVKVKSSSLYHLLCQNDGGKNDGGKLIRSLKGKFPKVQIKTILFRIG